MFQGNGGFATMVRQDTLKTLVECSLYSMLDHLANDSRPRCQDCVATQLLFRFMMEMLRQNMLEAYFHNIRLTFCYWRVHSCLLSVQIIVIQYHDLGQSDYRNYEQLQYRWNSLGPYNHIIQYYGTLILNAFIVWSCLKASAKPGWRQWRAWYCTLAALTIIPNTQSARVLQHTIRKGVRPSWFLIYLFEDIIFAMCT